MKAIKFLTYSPEESLSYMVSGADDKTLKLWTLNSTTKKYTCVQTVQEHTAAINCLDSLPGTDVSSRCLFVSGAADATLKLWELTLGKISLVQSIKTSPKFFPLAVSIHTLGSNHDAYVLAVAGTRDIIHIYASDARPTSTVNFTLQATLTGHEGWIRSLDFALEKPSDPSSDLLLASASQDKYIRLWRLHQGKTLPAAPAAGADPSLGAYLPGKSPSNKAHRFQTAGEDFSVTFEALLLGHDDWIYTAKWHSQPDKLQLLSASADNSLSIWEVEPTSGIWITSARLGEISREKGATTATGSIGGFWTGLWSPDGTSVATLGRTGSWRRWDLRDDRWTPDLAVSGHTRAVTGISWSRDGSYLLSTSSDQTTRQHAEWILTSDGSRRQSTTWHEMSRPQIHGYDLNCIDTLSNTSFVSGADEKLMRVFSAPKAVVRLVSRITGQETSQESLDTLPAEAADIPVLGLSNKAVVDANNNDDVTAADEQADLANPDAESATRSENLSQLDTHPTRPPLEDLLSRATLWPETEKLYGHGYELSCLSASHSGKLIASACRASSINHAVIRLFETDKWTELKPPLQAHSLTVTRVRFSSDDEFILSVGRDRQWVVWRQTVNEDGEENYVLQQADAKGHTRMILDCAWAPNSEKGRRLFATASRDKSVKIWVQGSDGKFGLGKKVVLDGGVFTAVDFLPTTVNGKYVLAVGTEGGKISVLTIKVSEEQEGGVEVVDTMELKPE